MTEQVVQQTKQATQKEAVMSEEQLSKEFKEYSVAEFFKRNRQMLGYSSKIRSLTTIVHEYVTNSLDACEEAGILPDITIEIQPVAALPREEVIAVGDGTTRQFEVPLEIYEADVLDFFVDGVKQNQKKEYDLRSEKRGKESVKTIIFKNAPIAGAKITARFAQGHLKVIAEDNGTGIPKKNVGQALGMLLAGTKFHQRKQKRGQQGIGACMRSDTLVPMADGRILTIKQIVDAGMAGQQVLSLDPNTMKLVPTKIKNCVKVTNPYFIRLRTKKGREIFLTPENPVLTLVEGKPLWIRADAVEKGQCIAAPNKLITTSTRPPCLLPLILDDSLQADEPELLNSLFSKLLQKFGSITAVAHASGIKKEVLRNWIKRKKAGTSNSRSHPKIKQLIELARLTGVPPESVVQNISRVGRRGTFTNIPRTVNEELCWIAGLLAGNGHLARKKDDEEGVAISFFTDDKKLVEKYCEALQNTFALNYNVNYDEQKHYYTVQTYSEILARVLEALGLKRGRKFDSFELSNNLLQLQDRLIAAYLRGLFDAEANVSKRIRAIEFCLRNKKAIEQIHLALLRLGIQASIHRAKEDKKLMICGKKNLEVFAQKIGFSLPQKNQLVIEIINSIKTDYYSDETVPAAKHSIDESIDKTKLCCTAQKALKNNCFTKKALTKVAQATSNADSASLLQLVSADVEWLEVIEKKLTKNNEKFVYDLEIEGLHNFVAGGIIAHNSYAILFSQITTGKTSHVKTGLGDGRVYECDISIDVKQNKPVITNEREYAGKFRGVRIESEFSEVTYNRSEYSVYEYLRRTALANPHAQITLIEPDKNIVVFPRVSKEIPKKPPACLPHPLGISTNDLMEMAQSTQARKISSFLTTEFSRFSSDKVKELAALVPQVNLERAPKALTWPEAEKIVQAIQKMKWIAPETDVLQPIGSTQIEKALKNLLQPEKMRVVERKPKVFRGGIPFLVEAAIAYGGKAGAGYAGQETREGSAPAKLEVLRYANRTPLLFDAGNCAVTEAVKTIDWNRYDLKDLENQPVSIFVNFVSVYVPYTGAGKLAISAEEEIVEEIRFALMECAREISAYLHSMQKAAEQEERRSIFMRYVDEVAEALHDITDKPKALLAEKLRQLAKEKTALLEAKEKEAEKILEKLEESEEKGFEEEGESKEE